MTWSERERERDGGPLWFIYTIVYVLDFRACMHTCEMGNYPA